MKKPFEKIIVVMFENQYRNYVLQDAFMRKLASAGANMSNYFGAFHPSQTNYLASLAGEVCAVTNDTPPAQPLMQKNLVDLLEPAGVSWKAYMEAYPNEAWKKEWKKPHYNPELQPINDYPNDGKSLARYFRKHNAFASFHSIQKDKKRWAKIVDDVAFWKDVNAETLPEYSWFTPDIWNDGHYLYNTHTDTNPRTQLIPQLAGWLEYVFFGNMATDKVQGGGATGLKNMGLNLDIDLLLENPKKAWENSNVPEGTLLVITFDEADFDAIGYDTSYEGPNQVYTVLLGDMIEPGTVIDVPYNHYSLIKTIEKNYGLGDLGKNDRAANWFRFLWDEKLTWTASEDTNLSTHKAMAVAALENNFHLLAQKKNGEIWQSQLKDNVWTKKEETGLKSNGHLALASLDKKLHLVYSNKKGELHYAHSKENSTWSKAKKLGFNTHGAICMSRYLDEADQKEKMMLCWQSKNGFIQYLIYNKGRWQKKQGEVGQLTDGPMALAQLGGSLFLVYKERNTKGMRMTTYNVAPYNAFEALAFDDSPMPTNNTVLHQWSPADMPVGNFSKKLNALQNQYLSLGHLAMASIEGEMHLIHRNAYDDTPSAKNTYFGLTGIFTAAHQLTNGYGTIDQAGWTMEQELGDIQLDPESPIAMCSDGENMLVVWQEKGRKELKFLTAGYETTSC